MCRANYQHGEQVEIVSGIFQGERGTVSEIIAPGKVYIVQIANGIIAYVHSGEIKPSKE